MGKEEAEIDNMKVKDVFNTEAALEGRTEIETITRSVTDPPIGAVIAWLKSLTNTPTLPNGWVECDGSVLSDGDSVYDGVTIPDLNGDNRFMRGNSTSGATSGAATHTHAFTTTNAADSGTTVQSGTGVSVASDDHSHTTGGAETTGTGSSLPPSYNVVWIIRVK